MRYAELHCLSNFSFQRAASHPPELVLQAHRLGYRALALTDECSVAGMVRAWEAARDLGMHLIVGSEFRLQGGWHLVLLARSHAGYSQLCRLITRGRRAAEKGSYHLQLEDFRDGLDDCVVLWKPADDHDLDAARWCARQFGERCWIGVSLLRQADDAERLQRLTRIGDAAGLGLVACGDVRMHRRSRQPLHDVLTAVRHGTTVDRAGLRLAANSERHLRSIDVLETLYPQGLLDASVEIAAQCTFGMDELHYVYPHELVPQGHSADTWLRQLAEQGAAQRWPRGMPEAVAAQLDNELGLVEEMGYAEFFLTVHDVVEYARRRNIYCQGRGSAANSVICYALGITEVDPSQQALLFERFISKERNEPPDIDVDFEHQRREEVIQYIYRKYGRERAALAATVITYQPRSALRDIGKALGFSVDRIDRLTGSMAWWDRPGQWHKQLRDAGFDPDDTGVQRYLELAEAILGTPRHLAQHVGGFVISEKPLYELVPVENSAMPDRTVIQWDKDDLEALGLLKVDCLALGMLTVLHRCLDTVNAYYAERLPRPIRLANIPREDEPTFEMIRAADTVGVFQIESRAQQSMLPRLKPRTFYDLVIEIAIVRPGPIQGEMVHPYLQRRADPDAVEYPSEELRAVLERTLGVPIFQEQVMQVAMVAAGFSAGEADQLRRAMAAWRRRGDLEPFRERLLKGMAERGYSERFAEQIYRQITGFGEYGFPESHSASFALLAWASAWLKCHYPAAFTCALLNSQPMGFFAPAQLIADARRHGIDILPVDIRYSDWQCLLEDREDGPGVRLGFSQVKGMREAVADRIVAARAQRPFGSVQDLRERAGLDRGDMTRLARANALEALAGDLHAASWSSLGTSNPPELLRGQLPADSPAQLQSPDPLTELQADYESTGYSLRHHPVALLRQAAGEGDAVPARRLPEIENGRRIEMLGVVTHRQRPGTASGVMFMGMEDDTDAFNVIVWPKILERQRAVILGSNLLRVRGTVQNAEGVQHLVATQFQDAGAALAVIEPASRDFH